MIGTHTTKDGEVTPLVLMETSHLINTINCFYKPIATKQSLLKLNNSNLTKLTGISASPVEDKEDLDLSIYVFLRTYNFYISELMRRALFLSDSKAKTYLAELFDKLDTNLLCDFSAKPKLGQSEPMDYPEERIGTFSDDFDQGIPF